MNEKFIVYLLMPILTSIGVFLASRYSGREIETVKTWKERIKLWFIWGAAIFMNLFFIYLLLFIQELYLCQN